MRVLGIIPARYQSSRFPGKPLIDLAGKTMIQRVYEQAKKSTLISEVIVATDDERIFNQVNSFGGKVIMTAVHHTNGTSRCGEVVQFFPDFDIVINIQGDEPLIDPNQIDAVLNLFQNKGVTIGTAAKKIYDSAELENENRIKVVLDKNNNALYFSRSAIPFVQGKKLHEWPQSINCYKHIGIYAWRKEVLLEILKLETTQLEKAESLEQLRWLYHGYKIAVAETEIETPNIDTPEDVKAVMKILTQE